MQLTPRSGARLQFGDPVLAVGEPERIDEVTKELGNSVKKLDHPQIIPIFVGIALGVLLGIKILLAISVLVHFINAMMAAQSGCMDSSRFHRTHLSVLVHMVLIVVLAKAMFFIHW